MEARVRETRAGMAGRELGKAIIEMSNLMYNENTKGNFFDGLFLVLTQEEGVRICQASGGITYEFRGGSEVEKDLCVVDMGGRRRWFRIILNSEKGITACKFLEEEWTKALEKEKQQVKRRIG